MATSTDTTATVTTTATTTTSTVQSSAFQGLGDLIKLLPTGTVFLFQFLNPILTNTGSCSAANKAVTGVLLSICAFSCTFASFTDSYVGVDGNIYYGIVTATGLLPFFDPNSASTNFSSLKLTFADFVHASFAVVVFAALSLLDPDTISCFYPSFLSDAKAVVMAVPPVIGFLAGVVFMLFPSTRHGIGYPFSTTTTAAVAATAAAAGVIASTAAAV